MRRWSSSKIAMTTVILSAVNVALTIMQPPEKMDDAVKFLIVVSAIAIGGVAFILNQLEGELDDG